MPRKTYPSDVTNEEWHLILPYLTLLSPDAPQREHNLREIFNALRWIIRTGAQWRYLPHDFPDWQIVQQQTQRWIDRDCFENLVHDLREMLRLKQGKNAQPTASVIDSRFVPSTPESGHRAAYNGHKAKKGSKLHAVVDTLGNLMALCVTAGKVDDRKPVEDLCEQVQALSGENVRVMFADQGYMGEAVTDDAEFQGIDLLVVNRPEGARGFVLLPRRWVVERSFAWVTRFRRLVRDYERLPEVFAGLHFAVFGILMAAKFLREVVPPT